MYVSDTGHRPLHAIRFHAFHERIAQTASSAKVGAKENRCTVYRMRCVALNTFAIPYLLSNPTALNSNVGGRLYDPEQQTRGTRDQRTGRGEGQDRTSNPLLGRREN